MQFANRIQVNQGTLTTRMRARANQSQEEAAQEQNLPQRQVRTIEALPGLVVRVTSGTLWLTQQGEAQDIILRSGQQWTASKTGRVVVQALETNANWIIRAPKAPTPVLKWTPLFRRA